MEPLDDRYGNNRVDRSSHLQVISSDLTACLVSLSRNDTLTSPSVQVHQAQSKPGLVFQ